MEIKLKNKWHDSWGKDKDYDVFGADINAEDKKEEIFLGSDIDFLHKHKNSGELSLPHMFPNGSLGFLPLKGFEIGENIGLYSVDIDKLKNSFPDFRMKVFSGIKGEEFMPDSIRHISSPLKEALRESSNTSFPPIEYELTGKDVFDFIELEMRSELEIEHMAETEPLLYAELSHSSRTDTPQFRSIEFPDIKAAQNTFCFSVNPTQLGMVSTMMYADTSYPRSNALHIVSLVAKNLAFDNYRKTKSFEKSLDTFNQIFNGKAIEAVSHAVYHCSTETEYGGFYISVIDSIDKGLNYLAKQGYGYDDISKMLHSKNNLFRDDLPLMTIARAHMKSPEFLKLCSVSAERNIQRSR